MFDALDSNRDGMITRDEFVFGAGLSTNIMAPIASDCG